MNVDAMFETANKSTAMCTQPLPSVLQENICTYTSSLASPMGNASLIADFTDDVPVGTNVLSLEPVVLNETGISSDSE